LDDLGATSNETRGAKRPGWPVDPYRMRRALWAGRFWLIGGAVAGLVLGLFWAKVVMGNAYRTTVVLKYEGGLHLVGYEFSTGHALEPAANALHRESVLRRIRDARGSRSNLVTLAAQIGYQFDLRAQTVQFSVYGKTPEDAADFAKLVTDVFLTYHQERNARRIEQELDHVSKRITAAEDQAEEARRRYNEFREANGISNLSSEQLSLVTSAAGLRSDSQLAESEIRALEARVASLESQLATIPKTSMVSSATSPERATYDSLRRELVSARASLSDDHPRVQALQQQVAQLEAQIRRGGSGSGTFGRNTTYAAVSRELRSAKSQLTMLRERQKGLSDMAERAQRRVESLSGMEGEASALLAEVEVNGALVSRLRANEATLEDALEDPPSGFSVLDPGAVPELPVRNKMKPVVFAGFLIVFGFGALALVLWREFRGLRVLTPAEIAFWGSGPVLAATPWPSDPLGLDELVAGLDDLAPEARGTLLILGGTPADAPLAQDLARRMNEDWFVDGPTAAAPAAGTSVPREPSPLTTPPPSGPYPIGGSPRQSTAPAQPSTALALRPVQLVRREQRIRLEAWDGPFEGQALRRAARLADRVIILVRSNAMTALALNGIHRRIGREEGIGYVVLALPEELGSLPDRVGNVVDFWKT
jgi:predicted  nucleic acid-binding Zn-ribbon protein